MHVHEEDVQQYGLHRVVPHKAVQARVGDDAVVNEQKRDEAAHSEAEAEQDGERGCGCLVSNPLGASPASPD